MKNKCLPTLLGIGLLIAAAILPGYGTTGQTTGVAVNIPFDFVVAGITLPPGQYLLSPISNRVLRVQGADGTNYALVLTGPGVSGRKSDGFGHVVFNCYGDRCFLSQVWAGGYDLGWELMMCPSEKQLAKRPTGRHVALLTVKSRS